MVIRVQPTPTRFPTKSLYPNEQHTLAFYIKCVPPVGMPYAIEVRLHVLKTDVVILTWCLRSPRHSGHYFLAPLTGHKEGSMAFMVLLVRPTQTSFAHFLAFSTKCVTPMGLQV